MALQTSIDNIPQQFFLNTNASTIRTLAISDAMRVTASRIGQIISLELEPNMSSGSNLAVGSFTLTPALPPSYRPPRTLLFSTLVNDGSEGVIHAGYVTISTDGLVTFTCPTGWFSGTYIPLRWTVSAQYCAF